MLVAYGTWMRKVRANVARLLQSLGVPLGPCWWAARSDLGQPQDTDPLQSHLTPPVSLLNCKAASSTLNLPKTQHRLPSLQDFRPFSRPSLCKAVVSGWYSAKSKSGVGISPTAMHICHLRFASWWFHSQISCATQVQVPTWRIPDCSHI